MTARLQRPCQTLTSFFAASSSFSVRTLKETCLKIPQCFLPQTMSPWLPIIHNTWRLFVHGTFSPCSLSVLLKKHSNWEQKSPKKKKKICSFFWITAVVLYSPSSGLCPSGPLTSLLEKIRSSTWSWPRIWPAFSTTDTEMCSLNLERCWVRTHTRHTELRAVRAD